MVRGSWQGGMQKRDRVGDREEGPAHVLGELSEKRAIALGGERWMGQSFQGPAQQPELRATLSGGSPSWAGGGPEPLPPHQSCPLPPAQASPHQLLHYTSSASSRSLGTRGCPETWGWGLEGGKTPVFSGLARPAAQSALEPSLAVTVENHPLDKRPLAPPIVRCAPTTPIPSPCGRP